MSLLEPVAAGDWSYDHAAHLLRRAAFGGTPGEIEEARQLGPAAAVSRVLAGTLGRRAAGGVAAERVERPRFGVRGQADMLRYWWLHLLATSPHPAREKMVLFWHGHFTTSARKVESGPMLLRQNEMFRRMAFGNFQRLTEEMVTDPAMVRFLDAEASNRAQPNENLARELMELFTLGEGGYTEEDVKEMARALTGLRIEGADGDRPCVVVLGEQQDADRKEVLGKRGRFTRPERFVRVIFAKERCAIFFCQRLWDFFAAGPAPAGVIDGLASTLRDGRYEVLPVLRFMFASRAFHAPRERSRQIKSPVQWFAQAMRSFGASDPPVEWAAGALRVLGQDLFEPPNVAGWPGGRTWTTTHRLMERYRLAGELVEHTGRMNPGIWNRMLPPGQRHDLPKAALRLCMILFQDPLTKIQREALLEYHERAGGLAAGEASLAATIRFLMATPEYQVC